MSLWNCSFKIPVDEILFSYQVVNGRRKEKGPYSEIPAISCNDSGYIIV